MAKTNNTYYPNTHKETHNYYELIAAKVYYANGETATARLTKIGKFNESTRITVPTRIFYGFTENAGRLKGESYKNASIEFTLTLNYTGKLLIPTEQAELDTNGYTNTRYADTATVYSTPHYDSVTTYTEYVTDPESTLTRVYKTPPIAFTLLTLLPNGKTVVIPYINLDGTIYAPYGDAENAPRAREIATLADAGLF